MDASGEMFAFVRAVELGGFSAAARDMGLTPSALSKLVTRLEDRLGVRLLNRTTRKLALTPEGEAFYASSQRILADIREAEAEVARHRSRPRGLLRVNVGVAFGLHQLSRAIPEFLALHPEMQVELAVTDRLIDLIEDGADVAIRTGNLADSTLVARRICDLNRTICASPAYLRKHGTPRQPEDLLAHNCILFSGMPSLRRWPFVTSGGEVVIEVTGNLSANNAESILQLAEAGAGIARLTDVIVGEALQAGRLKALLADTHHEEPLPMQAVYPQGRHRSPKVVAFVDWLVSRFGTAPWRTATAPRRRQG